MEKEYCKFCGVEEVECKCNDSANQYSGEENE